MIQNGNRNDWRTILRKHQQVVVTDPASIRGEVMWPDSIKTLTPLPVPLRDEPPTDLVEAFRQSGWTSAPASPPVRLVALLGTCTTDKYKECPNLPEWHVENAQEDGDEFLEDVGKYYWCDFDLIGYDGSSIRLRMAFNEGDADCNDGTWGVVWDRDTAMIVADLTSVGDCKGHIALVSGTHARAYASYSLPIPTDDESFGSCKLPFTLTYAENLEFEKLIGVAMRWCFSHNQI